MFGSRAVMSQVFLRVQRGIPTGAIFGFLGQCVYPIARKKGCYILAKYAKMVQVCNVVRWERRASGSRENMSGSPHSSGGILR
jgi:hypothetical protein